MTTAAPQTPELFEQFTGKALEGLSVWAEANHKVLRQLVDFSAATASEGVRAYAELQSTALAAVKTGQEYFLAQQGRLQHAQKDPVATFEKSVLDGVDGAQKALKVLETSGKTITKSAERLRESADKTGRDIQGASSGLASQLKTIYTPDAK